MFRLKSEVARVMWTVVFALVPALVAGVWFYGWNALRVTALCIFFCLGLEYVIRVHVAKENNSVADGSAAITGLLLAFNLPAHIPWWQLFIGSLFAIGIAKMSYGGFGKSIFNPALVGRTVMLISFPVHMTTFSAPVKDAWNIGADVVSSATPLGILAENGPVDLPGWFQLFLGNISGSIGETSALAILIGGVFMVYKKIITWHIPVFYLLSLAGFCGIFWIVYPSRYADPLFHLLSGGAMLAAWFMATDLATRPRAINGRILFAVLGGVICGAIRLFGSYPEGAAFSILIMNAAVPLIDKHFKPKRPVVEIHHD